MISDMVLKIAASAAVLVGLYFGEQAIEKRGYDRAWSEANLAISKKAAEAADQLARETAKTRTVEQALQARKNKQEIDDEAHTKTVVDLHDRLRALAGPAVRLRDPHATGCRGSSGSTSASASSPPGDRPGDPAETGGLLSTELVGLLQRLTREADEINMAYASCRADAYTVRGILGD